MTAAYDIARVATECEKLAAAIDAALKHALPDWMIHRLGVLHREANAMRREIENHNEEPSHQFTSPTAGRAGSAETAEPRGSTSTGNPEE